MEGLGQDGFSGTGKLRPKGYDYILVFVEDVCEEIRWLIGQAPGSPRGGREFEEIILLPQVGVTVEASHGIKERVGDSRRL